MGMYGHVIQTFKYIMIARLKFKTPFMNCSFLYFKFIYKKTTTLQLFYKSINNISQNIVRSYSLRNTIHIIGKNFNTFTLGNNTIKKSYFLNLDRSYFRGSVKKRPFCPAYYDLGVVGVGLQR